MRTGIGYGREAALSKYHERLAWLADNVGGRNGALLGLCNYGVRAGLADAQMASEIIIEGGSPLLTSEEVWRAIEKARGSSDYSSSDHRRRIPGFTARNGRPSPKPPPPSLGPGAASFVDSMIKQGEGMSEKMLIAASPVLIPTEPWRQTACFLGAMYDDTDYLFCGEHYHDGLINKTIRMAKHWHLLVVCTKRTIPYPLLILNPLTGQAGLTKDGKQSLRCIDSVRRCRYALVEFDDMPIEEQCAFWGGVIVTGVLPLRSLVFSGSKSLHGLVELGAADRTQWDRRTKELFCATANPNAPKNRQADRLCRTPDHLTRLAGSWRQDKKKHQSLLWLAAPRQPTTMK